jgi:hypothetical protein
MKITKYICFPKFSFRRGSAKDCFAKVATTTIIFSVSNQNPIVLCSLSATHDYESWFSSPCTSFIFAVSLYKFCFVEMVAFVFKLFWSHRYNISHLILFYYCKPLQSSAFLFLFCRLLVLSCCLFHYEIKLFESVNCFYFKP